MVAVALCAVALLAPTPASAAPLEVGVGSADITPATGYFTMGYVRSDTRVSGVHTRLRARAIVLRRGRRKLALVSEDLLGIPGGMVAAAAARLKRRGFSQRNVLVSASHTHSGPAGYFNHSSYNAVFMTANSPTDFQLVDSHDPQLYAFMVRRLATAIRRADRNLGPGRIGWGRARIEGVTKNRSIEAHLANHGIAEPYGAGSPSQDPAGPDHTVAARFDLLRADKRLGGRWTPVGIWATFANHGTVNRFQFSFYNQDHHGAATLLTERRIRRLGAVPRGQPVVAAYGNGTEGDMTAGLDHRGPADAERVGRIESRGFIRAWRRAGRSMSRRPRFAWRWTRMCFCGQDTARGPVDDEGFFGLAQFTGSEENRGPMYDLTRKHFEGTAGPDTGGPQGRKVITPLRGELPQAVPLTTVRIGDRMIASVPGEMTKEMGARVRGAVASASRRSGVRQVVIAGLANEFISYLTTPEEYDRQHYEGAATLFGRTTSVAIMEVLAELAARLAARRPAPPPYAYDPRNGIRADAEPYGSGAARATVVAEPPAVARRLGDPTFRWRGGERGLDRRLDRPFVRVQHRYRRPEPRWRTIDVDAHGFRILWTIDDEGRYTARWEPALSSPLGRYRFKIQANRYSLLSEPFRLRRLRSIELRRRGSSGAEVTLSYPPAEHDQQDFDPPNDADADLTWRPRRVPGRIEVRIRVNGRPAIAVSRAGRLVIDADSGDRVRIPAGAVRDRHGNTNRAGISFRV